ncbi:Hypothetical protein, putative [Bodo saltans]|uniref:Uncharacterized protein n=1 Tax=Bodo saltans TaxID=75058 RepID=A0A0S4KN30_BODSA|nr:Hypothetical protein, putative [Bodo saltans]|eukprot:CUI14945.1 Hypothetical protein, putative [Bodo saltans]
MDSVSSASKALMEYMSTPSTSSSKSVAESKLALLEISGIALTVPYLIKMGVSASEATTLRPAATTLITSLFRDAEATFSPFLPTSELEAKINKVRHTDRIHVSPNMMEVLAVCNDLVDWSDDHFDPTCVPVGRWAVAATKSVLQQTNSLSTESRNNIEHSSWFPSVSTEESGDVTNAIQSVVSGADFAEKRRHVGWRANIVLGADWVQKRSPHTEMDISAVSKKKRRLGWRHSLCWYSTTR